ncbi:ATP-binding protein [Micromonospora sp. NBC_01813]|uniref:ATP-binding protein n=1 Tax=Micromonospora sp. NBC_01813 TaxID=2975988 RepID=UPI002DDA2564|nr:ATP-binding protein [Micromonospora sp. NBC_01813]WSA12240.1 ATP-binding protein [Micromonospora sp. NBC_01813]
MAATRTQSSRIHPSGTSARRATAPEARGERFDRGPDRVRVTAPLRCVLECDPTDPVIRLLGVLDRRNVAEVRDALLRCLADRAAPVAVDVSALRDVEPTALLRLAEAAAEVADWPAGGFVCCAPAPGTERRWAATGVTVLPDRRLATALLAGAPSATALGLDLEPVAGAARAARELLAQASLRWNIPQLIEPAALALTEMVNNVVLHAGTAMSVRVGFRDGCLRLSVRDGSAARPAPARPVPPTALGGRGMLLVGSVVRRWGCSPLGDGKLVWAVLEPADHPREGF